MASLSFVLVGLAHVDASLDPEGTFWPPTAEIENFTVTPRGTIRAVEWGREHYFGATFSDTFASRKALLHAPANATGRAVGSMIVPSAGTWYVCVRYEAPYRFEADFTVTVSQGGATRLTKVYGKRSSPKIWPFGWSLKNHEIAGCGADPTPECHWTWGATEGWVWEYYPASLAAGSVALTIDVANTSSVKGGLLGDRNLDVVLLTNNLTDISMRMLNEQQLALDGLLSQHGEVFVKVANHGPKGMRLVVPEGAMHAAYPSQHLLCIPTCHPNARGQVYSSVANLYVDVAAGATSAQWVDIGTRLDSFNDGSITFTSNISSGYTVEVGATVGGGAVRTIATFASDPSLGPSVEMAFSANTRATGWARAADFELAAALEEANSVALPAGAKPPTLTPIWGYSFCSQNTIRAVEPGCYLESSTSPSYESNLAQFLEMFPLAYTQSPPPAQRTSDPKITGDVSRGRGYYEARYEITDLAKLEEHLKNLSATGLADKVMVVSVGDEISLSVPSDPATAQTLFAKWCAAHHVPVPCTYNVSWTGSAQCLWYSTLFANQYGLDALAQATALLTRYLKKASVGANFSPLTCASESRARNLPCRPEPTGDGQLAPCRRYAAGGFTHNQYMYPVNKGVTAFRRGALTLPWGEDFTWQTPVGSQQMTTLLLDMFRAGRRHATTPETSRTMFYTLAHAPGNTPTSWRRNFYGYWAHGMTMLNLYELRPTVAGFTENYVNVGWGLYIQRESNPHAPGARAAC